jgi:hypothetical protein
MSINDISSLEWGHRQPGDFMQTMVENSAMLSKFTVKDGVKSKLQVPIFDAQLTYTSDVCTWDPQSTGTISEKEVSVNTRNWQFENCKNVLQNTYRSEMLKKGQHNAETLDSEFKSWILERFAQISAKDAVIYAADQITAELTGDSDVIDVALSSSALLDPTTVIAELEKVYLGASTDLKKAIQGGMIEGYVPELYVSANVLAAFSVAYSKAFTTIYGEGERVYPKLHGMNVVAWDGLADNEVIMAQPSNLWLITDDFNDIKAIDSEYERKVNTDRFWGQMLLNFSYGQGERIVYGLGV